MENREMNKDNEEIMTDLQRQERRQSHLVAYVKLLDRAQTEDTERRPSVFLEAYALGRLLMQTNPSDRRAEYDRLCKWKEQL